MEEGATYHVQITTSDNQVYQSAPQTIPLKKQIDSISFEILSEMTGHLIQEEALTLKIPIIRIQWLQEILGN